MEETKEQNVTNEEIDETIIDENQDVTEEDHEANAEKSKEINIEEILQENEQLKQETTQLKDRMLRIQAEYDNFKRRTNEERLAERKYQSEKLAIALLSVLDNFERALQVEITEENKGLMDGMQMIYNQFAEALQSEEITAINAVNEQFDPNIHQAVMQVEDESVESNIVVEELQKGYMLKDKVIRPAMVKVNK
ncbi:MAG TPA: nucleotide exchange factor GrpE [Candidatus Pseudogracilibacillus intestinigallinarum]|uniref:Protein GrpE n=1 Tax=Candidatus Pseudogracilibacillus intestinigallinarum TaxID=2838742 RepID=A0A9D1PN49_9BACI|nr:nucleotide exchange factor GrpE [Candidatus Pseudogracilibacillus intestinigallinarum]